MKNFLSRVSQGASNMVPILRKGASRLGQGASKMGSGATKVLARSPRLIILIAYLVLGTMLITWFTTWLAGQFSTAKLVADASFVAGIALSVTVHIIVMVKFFFILNSTTAMFVTQDTLASLFGIGEVNVSYGPGLHLCFPWERRIAENNILLKDEPYEFTFTVQRPDGTLKGKGSYRLRPDRDAPVEFLSGVAAVAGEVKDLVIADILYFFENANVSAVEAAAMIPRLNKYLEVEFVEKKARVEEKAGVCISDVTIIELLPSDELQRTISSISEVAAIQKGVEIFLGMTSAEINAALKDGALTADDVKRAREHVLAISGNMDNLKINRSEFDVNVRGLSPELAQTLTELAKTPAAQAAATAAVTRGRGGSK